MFRDKGYCGFIGNTPLVNQVLKRERKSKGFDVYFFFKFFNSFLPINFIMALKPLKFVCYKHCDI